ncbi:MAG: hypothetical protein CM15mV4_0600 [Caudoviricetes sp.]|nr:MAG: hypothetical protein CM15mV4_0600 [Caudoviricetes sp.]
MKRLSTFPFLIFFQFACYYGLAPEQIQDKEVHFTTCSYTTVATPTQNPPQDLVDQLIAQTEDPDPVTPTHLQN